jgi:hypothetical protein
MSGPERFFFVDIRIIVQKYEAKYNPLAPAAIHRSP